MLCDLIGYYASDVSRNPIRTTTDLIISKDEKNIDKYVTLDNTLQLLDFHWFGD